MNCFFYINAYTAFIPLNLGGPDSINYIYWN